jgi:cellulose biosynthesis protein BcsQ
MGIIVSLLNHKGGVGKTTSTINIGAGLKEQGKKVLLIDLDPQANLSISLGIPRQKAICSPIPTVRAWTSSPLLWTFPAQKWN